MRLGVTVCLVVLVVSLCDGIVVFPNTVQQVGLLPVPLFFGGLPIHVAVMFLGFYGAMWIATWIAKGKIEKDYHYDYDVDLLYKLNSRTGREFGGSEEDMRHAMAKTLSRIDTDKCLQKLVCFLEEQSDRSQEEEILLKIFPVTQCKSSVFPRCTAREEQLRELMHYYQSVEIARNSGMLGEEEEV